MNQLFKSSEARIININKSAPSPPPPKKKKSFHSISNSDGFGTYLVCRQVPLYLASVGERGSELSVKSLSINCSWREEMSLQLAKLKTKSSLRPELLDRDCSLSDHNFMSTCRGTALTPPLSFSNGRWAERFLKFLAGGRYLPQVILCFKE